MMTMPRTDPTTPTGEMNAASPAKSKSISRTNVPSPTSALEIAQVLRSTMVDGKNSVWSMTRGTLRKAKGGKSKLADVFVETEEEALTVLQGMVLYAKETETNKGTKTQWNMPWTPYKEMNATIDDILLCFCRWARKPDSKSPTGGSINVSKAFRRVESYAAWMYHARMDLFEPLTAESVRTAATALPMRLTYDSEGRLVWWIDVQQQQPKGLPVKEVVRYIVWLTHVCMLDPKAQDKGLVLVQGFENMTFWQMMRLFPAEARTKLERLTVGVLPIKMKAIYILYTPTWMKMLTTMMAPFMSKKMRQRLVTIKSEQKDILDSIGPKDRVPKNYCGLKGTLEKDLITSRYHFY